VLPWTDSASTLVVGLLSEVVWLPNGLLVCAIEEPAYAMCEPDAPEWEETNDVGKPTPHFTLKKSANRGSEFRTNQVLTRFEELVGHFNTAL
jgi:hypothetical protein